MTRIPLILTACQLRMARAALRLSVEQAAKLSEIAPNTLRRLERGDWPAGTKTAVIERLQMAFEGAGVQFLAADEHGAAGVRCPG